MIQKSYLHAPTPTPSPSLPRPPRCHARKRTRSSNSSTDDNDWRIKRLVAPACSGSTSQSANIVQFTLSGDYPGDLAVLIDAMRPSRCITRNKAEQLIASLAGAFKEDSTVCLHLENDILYPVICLAIWASKCRWTGTNPAYKTTELEHHFRTTKTNYVITTENRLQTVVEAVERSGAEAEVIIFTDILAPSALEGSSSNQSANRTLHDLQQIRSTRIMRRNMRDIDVDAIATLCSTSGTTGLPKMAARTHRAVIVEATADEDNHRAKDYQVRRLFCTPIFHAFSTPEMVINSIRLGTPTYYMRRFDETLFPQYIRDFNITETFAPPALLLRLVDKPSSHEQIQSLRQIYTGGSPLKRELRAKFERLYKSKPPHITQVWGMTEGGWFTSFKFPERDETGSVGRALPGVNIRMSDELNTTTLQGDTAGELHTHGAGIMQGYFGNPQATRNTFTEDGWLKTGDIGFVKDGKVYLVDRAKDMIKVNGFQISPTEIENTLMKLEGAVKDCAVVGVGDDVDEHPYAFVVRTHDGVNAEFLKRHLLESLVSYKANKCEIAFVDSLPKSVTGKVLRSELRKLARHIS